jgi:hypothetical protein
MAKDAPGMKWERSRNKSWPLRKKRSDTHLWTIEKQYWVDFWRRSDMELGNYLKETWENSLNDLMTWK